MTFDKRLFIGLYLSFILATIIGTITHECGHYFAAKFMGYDAGINYGYSWIIKSNPDEMISNKDYFLFTLGGPMETMMIGTIGLALLFLARKSFKNIRNLSISQWFLIFISLFWLRPLANLVVWMGSYFVNGYFSTNMDEIKLAKYLVVNDWILISFTALIGATVLYIIIFKLVPVRQRLTFIVSGITGGITGYIMWLFILGRYIMP